MNTVAQITDQLRACNFEHVRAVVEPDDVMVLIDYLEGQGFISAEAQAVLDAEAEANAAAAQAEAEAQDASVEAKAAEEPQ